ncbi:hypothetical protein [Dyella sp. RRB7]|uniref:hypothetical protein n=1 Tax=Dyella sp. RRB7 TaxID=2919502 RepID=UPI001FA9FC22|nr:hypothetical protein [Dyella sp. RRB7]
MKQPRVRPQPAVINEPGGPALIRPRRVGATSLQVAAFQGLGLWMLLGLALAVGVYPSGRGDALVPLALGALLLIIGLVAACVRAPWMPTWHGWRIGKDTRPTREALIVLASFLPMLAVAGLARGDNTFWATRLAGAALTLCSLVSLTVAGYADIKRRMPGLDTRLISQLPLSRVVSAAYGGGLWLWLCAAGQDGGDAADPRPWIVGLLLLALLRGLVEGMRWQAVLQRLPVPRARLEVQPRRYLAASLIYALPCLALILASFDDGRLFMAALATLSCMAGMSIELSLYDEALAALPDSR